VSEVAPVPGADVEKMGESADSRDESSSKGEHGDALLGIPLPPGATAGVTGTIRWDGLPFFLVRDLDTDPADFGEFVFQALKMDSSAGRVLEFFRENRGDWEERFSAVEPWGGILLWTSADADCAAWIVAAEDKAGTDIAIATAKRRGSTG